MKREISKYRLRGFRCATCGFVQKVFGNDPAPETCVLAPCVGAPVLQWDQLITQSTEAVDYQPGVND